MNALLLSAGIGERLRPLTLFLPKCLLPATSDGNLLRYWIRLLAGPGKVEKIFINVFWLKEKIYEYLEKHFWFFKDNIIVFDEGSLMPIGEVLYHLKYDLGDEFLVINSDTFIEKEKVVEFIRHAKVSPEFPVCLGLSWRENVAGKSIVEVEGDIVMSFTEKPEPREGFAYAGILLMHQEAIKACPFFKDKELTQHILPLFSRKMTYFDVGQIVDIGGSIEQYLEDYERIIGD